MKTKFFIVRHGESEGNVDMTKNEYNPSLTKLGREQAQHRSELLKDIHFDHAYTSYLSRAIETARILLQGRNIPHTLYEDLHERVYGNFFLNPDLEVLIQDIFEKEAAMPVEAWWTFKHEKGMDVETYQDCFGRFYKRFQFISEQHPGENILIVSHGDLMRGLLVHSNYGTHQNFKWDAIKNTGYIVLEMEKGKSPEIITTVDIKKSDI